MAYPKPTNNKPGWLVLTRKPGEKILIGDDTVVKYISGDKVWIDSNESIMRIDQNTFRVGNNIKVSIENPRPGVGRIAIDAPKNIKILREELL